MNPQVQKLQDSINEFKLNNPDTSLEDLSDTYHSFKELYKHRTILFASVINMLPGFTYKSWKHESDDFPMFEGMFIVGAITPFGQISYHVDAPYWNLFRCNALEKAPKFDGHTPNDVLDRLSKIINSYNLSEQSERDRYLRETAKNSTEYYIPESYRLLRDLYS